VSQDIIRQDTAVITPDARAEIAALAHRSRAARGIVMKVIGLAGSQAENMLEKLPDGVKTAIEAATGRALGAAYRGAEVAGRSPRAPDLGPHGHSVAAALSGAAGGFGGLGSAVVEIPVTVSIMFSAIQRAAKEAGFDPSDDVVRRECLLVFAAGDPFDVADDGVNTSFLMSRTTITGASLHRLIAAVAPRLATVLSEKLATQALPVLGSVAGAGINLAFIRYYRELAEIRFALLRLARVHGEEAVREEFLAARGQKTVGRG